MKNLLPYAVWIITVAFTGCSSSSPENTNQVVLQSQSKKELPHTDSDHLFVLPESSAQPEISLSPFDNSRPWKPRFIQTGLSSGIMIEFTGMKKGKKLSAKHANMELLRYLPDTTTDASTQKSRLLAKPAQLQSAINDLQQAFFKVSPGKYLARLTNAWGDRTFIRDVEVKDGEYSVLTNDVYAAWLRMKQLSDSTEER